jgi:putative salt-induced outer membrane protein
MKLTHGMMLAAIALLPLAALADDPSSTTSTTSATSDPTSTTSDPTSATSDPTSASHKPPPPMGWTGKGQLGFMDSQGNSPAKSANAALDMSYTDDPWKHMLHLDALYAQSAGITSAERYDALWQSNYNFTSDLFTFGALRYGRDLFDGFQYQASGTAGIGYKLFDSDTTKLSVQLGAGYMASHPETLSMVDGVTYRTLEPRSEDYAVGTAGVDYSQKLTGTTTLSDTLLVNAGAPNTLITNTLALTVKVAQKLALSLGYNIQDNTRPPPHIKSLDTVETVNLVYSF